MWRRARIPSDRLSAGSARLSAAPPSLRAVTDSPIRKTLPLYCCRNIGSKHLQRWLGVESRSVVPFTSSSQFNKAVGGDIWFALIPGRFSC
jgi:hypothetical protein